MVLRGARERTHVESLSLPPFNVYSIRIGLTKAYSVLGVSAVLDLGI